MRKFIAVIIAAAFLSSRASAATPEEVENAIRKGVEHLYQTQAGDNWDNNWKQDNSNTGGRTALVVYALLAAGESPQNPKLKSAVDFLLKQEVKGVYTLGIRCNVWFLLPQTPEIKEVFRTDALDLQRCMKVKGKARGLFNYVLDNGQRYDHSVSQYGVLGLWAAAQANIELSSNVWKAMDEAWRLKQDKNGGWKYSDAEKEEVRASMTAAGVASLFITQEYTNGMAGINCTGNIKDENIERGLKWMSDNFKKVDNYYTWYGVERIGVASGLKYFGTVNWYQHGADHMVHSQNKEGGWGGEVPDTAFAILFLVRGRAPVMMNKLEYVVDTAGDKAKPLTWNQRPRDVANIARWIGRQIEKDLNWQIVNLNVHVEEFHDAPILYISGRDSLVFTSDQEAKLKTFVEQGGIILGNADCASKPFAESFRKLGTKLFGWEFRELPEDHPIYTSEQYRRAAWKNKPSLLGLSNGARELMLLFPTNDPAKGWQTQSFLGPDREPLSQLTANIFLYAVDKQNLRFKGDTYLVKANKEKPEKTLKVARLQYSGNWDPEPGGWRRLNFLMQNEHKVGLDVQTVKLGDKKLLGQTIAHITGTGRFTLNTLAREEIRKYVEAGGTLVIDAAGGNGEFANAVETELHAIFPAAKAGLKIIPISHPLYSKGNKIEEVEYRPFARKSLGNIHTPRLRGLEVNNRIAVILSGEDLSVGLVGQPVDGIVGYMPHQVKVGDQKTRMGASEIMTNILMYAAK